MPDAKTLLETTIERSTGRTVEWLRNTPLCELRRLAERAHGRPATLVSSHPRIITREEIDRMLDQALRK